MTQEEKSKFIDELKEQFLLVPKNRIYYFIGGSLTFALTFLGVSIVSVMAYLRTEPVEIARKRIVEIRKEVEQHHKDLGVGQFVRFGDPVSLYSGIGFGPALANSGGVPVMAQESTNLSHQWKLKPNP